MKVNLNQLEKPVLSFLTPLQKGEEIIITDGDETVAKVVPMKKLKPSTKAGSLKGEIVFSHDFNAPLSDFEEYAR